MAISFQKSFNKIREILTLSPAEELAKRLAPRFPEDFPLPEEFNDTGNWSADAFQKRLDHIQSFRSIQISALPTGLGQPQVEDLRGNIENFIGMTQVPTGIIGPVRVNGLYAKGDFLVPMATTEGALVASYHRGTRAAGQAGGITALCVSEGIQRAPGFVFTSIQEAGLFLIWLMDQVPAFEQITGQHTSHGKLEEIRPHLDGNQLTVIFDYQTGDAAGQNMVTICTQAICEYIISKSPIQPRYWFVESNLSGDKKATAISFSQVRGKKVTAEVHLPPAIVSKYLHSTPEKMMNYWKMSILNGIQSGSIGVNGHFANGLAAIFLATGQDIACVSEASVGTTRFDILPDGNLYACVTLPNLVLGTVGGGTRFPTQQECLDLMDCNGTGHSKKMAEIVAASILCGELSIIAALSSGDFTRAHQFYGRKKK
ncbi:MAG: hydroxymethylglutaryl-CoA reductase [Bacteroidetes bacterium]|nr:hydroxymethylglutaryl-CoA reductase [Bacteroidota bacterium]